MNEKERTCKKLPTAQLDEIAAGFRGRIGFYIEDMTSGESHEYAADDRFPTASVCKVPVMIELFRQVEEGTLSLDERRRLGKNISKEFASGCLRDFEDEPELTLHDYCRVMVTVSDDMAADILMEAVGLDNVNATLDKLGYHNTRTSMSMGKWHYTMAGMGDWPCSPDNDRLAGQTVRSKGNDYESLSYQDSLENNVASPRDMGSMLAQIHHGKIASPSASAKMIDLLKTCRDRRMIAHYVAPGVPIAHKSGSSGRIRADVGIVYLPSGPLIVTALAYASDDQASPLEAIAQISRLAVEAMSPGSVVQG